MATVTTRAQQTKIGDAADLVGGYDKLIELSAKKREALRRGLRLEIRRDQNTGEWKLVPARKIRMGQVLGKRFASRKSTSR